MSVHNGLLFYITSSYGESEYPYKHNQEQRIEQNKIQQKDLPQQVQDSFIQTIQERSPHAVRYPDQNVYAQDVVEKALTQTQGENFMPEKSLYQVFESGHNVADYQRQMEALQSEFASGFEMGD